MAGDHVNKRTVLQGQSIRKDENLYLASNIATETTVVFCVLILLYHNYMNV